MSNTADYAATAPWTGIIGRPNIGPSVTDIGELKAAGFVKRDLAQWNGVKFLPVKPSSIIDVSTFYSPSNKPYQLFGFKWNPGTLSPFFRVETSFSIAGITDGQPVAIGVPYSLQGCGYSIDESTDSINVTLFNQTPYDVTFASGIWDVLVMK